MKGTLRWEPAIYEHKAGLIDSSPSEVAASAALLLSALQAEYHAYHADIMTVGIDVYNVEAEACGAEVIPVSPQSCPEIRDPLWNMPELPAELEVPSIPGSGRFCVLLEAGQRFLDSFHNTDEQSPQVRIAASGPVSIAAKLVGTEAVLMGVISEDQNAIRLLDFCTEIAVTWLGVIRSAGMRAVVFDSSASPPMFSPDLYGTCVEPLHRRMMQVLAEGGQSERALILGGDTTILVDALVSTGANQLICDYAADARVFAKALSLQPEPVTIRRNVNPALLDHGGSYDVQQYVADLKMLSPSIAGTGILPYGQAPEHYAAFRTAVDAEWKKGEGDSQ